VIADSDRPSCRKSVQRTWQQRSGLRLSVGPTRAARCSRGVRTFHCKGYIKLDFPRRCFLSLRRDLMRDVPRRWIELIRRWWDRCVRWWRGLTYVAWPYIAGWHFRRVLQEVLGSSRGRSYRCNDPQCGFDCGTRIHEHPLRKNSGTARVRVQSWSSSCGFCRRQRFPHRMSAQIRS
jgi:hypothetical protein